MTLQVSYSKNAHGCFAAFPANFTVTCAYAGFLQTSTLAKAYSAWRQALCGMKKKQQQLQTAGQLFGRTRLTKAWHVWRQVVGEWKMEQAMLQGAVAFSVREKLEHAWRSWVLAVRRAQRKVHSAGMAASFSHDRMLGGAWRTWQEAAAVSITERQREQAAQDSHFWSRLVLPFAGWRELAAEGAENRQAADVALSRHLQGQLASVWLQWRTAAVLQQEMRARAEHSVQRLRRSQLAAALHAWVDNNHHNRAAAAQVQPRPGLMKPSQYSIYWLMNITIKQDFERIMDWYLQRDYRAMKDWGKLTCHIPLLCAMLQADRAVQHLHARRMAAAFTVWRDATAQALTAADAMHKALAFWAQRMLATAFLGWHGHTIWTLAAEDRAAGASCCAASQGFYVHSAQISLSGPSNSLKPDMRLPIQAWQSSGAPPTSHGRGRPGRRGRARLLQSAAASARRSCSGAAAGCQRHGALGQAKQRAAPGSWAAWRQPGGSCARACSPTASHAGACTRSNAASPPCAMPLHVPCSQSYGWNA